MRSVHPNRVGLVSVFLALAIGAGCSESEPESGAEPPPVVQAYAVTASPQPGQTLSGEVVPRFDSAMSFRVGGEVVERRVEVGDRLKPGAVLMKLDPTDFELALDALQANMDATRSEIVNARSELARLERLFQKNLTSEQSLDRAQNQLNVLQARLETQKREAAQTQHQIDYATLRVPDNLPGLVKITDVLTETGEVVNPGQPVLRLASVAPTEVAVDLPQSLRQSPPETVSVTLNEQTFELALQRSGDQANPQSRTWPAWYGLADTDKNHQAWLKQAQWGKTVAARLPQADQALPAFRVPVSALLRRGETAQVWQLQPDEDTETGHTLVAVSVRVQAISHDWAWVQADASRQNTLGAGDELVAFGVHKLHAGQAVRRLAP
ncbi:MAG: efflux RND transporter periplasmic adaptor subunit [Hydrogenovibrio sp.]|uniref:efflux RND transporter periplasmic adaptor subunit n=1 Tax=Hydrogenovibrio sp. TaxID=2065821 RepID=UPI0028703A79|nr:efflux RND transporter periplasmic adaptor subunit [Hydrogenovibrio sp.]MDR9498712.1 efflux RND transporter periplasmic adaptor subunit [Hydrogenovibrio sp.]